MKNLTILKNDKKKSDKEPDYRMSTKIGEEYVTIGACWLKDGAKGKYFSCKLSDAYNDRPEYEIIEVGKDAFVPPTTHPEASTSIKDEATGNVTSPSNDYPEGLDLDKAPF